MDEDKARNIVATAIASGLNRTNYVLSSSEIDDLAAELLPCWEEPAAKSALGSLSAFLPGRYVIPDHDLKVIETCFSVFAASAAAGFLIPQLGADPTKALTVPITGIIIAVLKLVQNLRLAVQLQPCEYAIVALLSKARIDGLTTLDILEALRPSWKQLTAESLESLLTSLTACATVSGTKATLVWRDGAGHWRSNGV